MLPFIWLDAVAIAALALVLRVVCVRDSWAAPLTHPALRPALGRVVYATMLVPPLAGILAVIAWSLGHAR